MFEKLWMSLEKTEVVWAGQREGLSVGGEGDKQGMTCVPSRNVYIRWEF